MSFVGGIGGVGGGQRAPQQIDPRQALGQLRADPVSVLRKAGFSVPDGMSDPNAIYSHLMQSGQIGGPLMQSVRRVASMLGMRI